jgi:hypothetical protein
MLGISSFFFNSSQRVLKNTIIPDAMVTYSLLGKSSDLGVMKTEHCEHSNHEQYMEASLNKYPTSWWILKSGIVLMTKRRIL